LRFDASRPSARGSTILEQFTTPLKKLELPAMS
jgi:hypothetical protein